MLSSQKVFSPSARGKKGTSGGSRIGCSNILINASPIPALTTQLKTLVQTVRAGFYLSLSNPGD